MGRTRNLWLSKLIYWPVLDDLSTSNCQAFTMVRPHFRCIQLRKQLKELKLDMEAIFLDSINRNLEHEEDVTKSFVGDDKKIMQNMVDTEKGL